jgi:hypothetical protein
MVRMAFRHRIYRATEAGLQALQDPPAGISLPCMRILALLKGETHYAVVRADMRMCEEEQVGTWLQELETRGLVSSQADQAESDLDFTGSLSLAAVRAGHNAG